MVSELNTNRIPNSTSILVIGGGPAGAYAACVLAREGFQVSLFEKEEFPRYHIGESMLPSFNNFMTFIDAHEKVKKCQFVRKPGAAIKLNQFKKEGYTNFIAFDESNSSFNIVRSQFDGLLLKHAAECGVSVFQGVTVNEIQFSSIEPNKPVSASWTSKDGQSGKISFEWLVDGSGRTGILSTRYLKSRRFNESLRNIALWGYWTGELGVYSPGTDRENAPWFEALTDETGWAWYIPLHNGTASVGVVISERSNRTKKSNLKLRPGRDVNVGHYLMQLKLAPGVGKLIEKATLSSPIRSAGDYSYSSAENQYAGPNYRIVGDAGAFIDPLFSSGVHLAFTGGLSAASTIAASIRGQCTEDEAIKFHDEKVGTSYTRFLVTVWAAYKQMKSQSSPVLSEVDEDNFDRAFDFLRPVIQGATESEPHLTEGELNGAIDFCRHAIGPADPEMLKNVSQRINPDLLAPHAAVMTPKEVEAVAGDDEEAKQVLWKVNSDKALGVMFDYKHNFRSEILNGFYVNLEQGKLGLLRACQ